MQNRIVIHYNDGRVERGYTTDFRPQKEIFHLIIKIDDKEKSLPVKLTNLKAIFFVKELHGKGRDRPVVKRTFDEVRDKRLIGKKVRVDFDDGESLYGLTLGYSPQRRGFFFL